MIKNCNKVLESMLVRRERKYTLLFRVVGTNPPHGDNTNGVASVSTFNAGTDKKMLQKMRYWNAKVEKALGGVTQQQQEEGTSGHDTSGAEDSGTESRKGSARLRNPYPLSPRYDRASAPFFDGVGSSCRAPGR